MSMKKIANIILIWLFTVMAVMLLLAVVPSLGKLRTAVRTKEDIKPVWVKEKLYLKSFDVTPDGSRIAYLDTEGKLYLETLRGTRIFTRKSEDGENSVVLSPDGKYAAVYSSLPAEESAVTIVRDDGRAAYRFHVPRGVSSVDSAKLSSGCRFVAGSYSNAIYVADVTNGERKSQTIETQAQVTSVCITDDGNIIYGTKSPGRVVCVDSEGKPLWNMTNVPPESKNYITHLSKQRRYLILSKPYSKDEKNVYMVIDENGTKVTAAAVDYADNGTAVSPCGTYLASGYEKILRHKEKTASERHVFLCRPGIDDPDILWDLGSFFFPIIPISVNTAGAVLAVTEDSFLYMITPGGSRERLFKLPTDIANFASTRNDAYTFIYCKDGTLYCLSNK